MGKVNTYGLEKCGFSIQKKVPPKRVVMSLMGQEGTGKNTFAFTMPKPIALIDLEMGYERAKTDEGDEREWLIPKTIFVPPGLESATEYFEKWKEFLKALRDAFKSGVPSIVVDTATMGWQLLRLAQFGRLTQIPPRRYGEINPVWQGLMQEARLMSKSNVCWIHRTKEEYATAVDPKSGKPVLNKKGDDAVQAPTGSLCRDGYGKTGFEVDVELAMYMEGGRLQGSKKWSRNAGNKEGAAVFGCEVLKNGFGTEGFLGERFEGSGICTFPFVMGQLTGTDESRWQ